MSAPRIAVFGAGSIGGYVGGRLIAAGAQVDLIGRARLRDELARHGLRLTDYRGADLTVPAASIAFAVGPDPLNDADLILVTVKSAATGEAAGALAGRLKPGAVVVSFQNGLGHAEALRAALPGATVLAGMVPFNVVHRGQGAFHQGSEGDLKIEQHEALAPFVSAFENAGLPLRQTARIRDVQWAKLLLNLNNAVNALSGRPLREQLSLRAYRRCTAMAQREGLAWLDRAGIRPDKLTPLPPSWIPLWLGLPDAWFRHLASPMLKIDPLARSSMWDDLDAGRTTEVDWLNGEIVRLAQQHGGQAPVNAALCELIREAERGGRRDWGGDELLERLRRAAG